jgi:hypothetical protein
MPEESATATGRVGLPYLVTLRGPDNAEYDHCWGPLTAMNPTDAVAKAMADMDAMYKTRDDFEVYPVGVTPNGGVESITVTQGELNDIKQ